MASLPDPSKLPNFFLQSLFIFTFLSAHTFQRPIPFLGMDFLSQFGMIFFILPKKYLEVPISLQASFYIPYHPPNSQNLPCPLLISLVNSIVWNTASRSLDSQYKPPFCYTQRFFCLHLQSLMHPPLAKLIGLKHIIKPLLFKQFLWPTSSPYNTPKLAVIKSNWSFCLLQDLCSINTTNVLHHPGIPNLQVFLSTIHGNATFFYQSQLQKDALFQ